MVHCVKQVACGTDYSIALIDDGSIIGWGSNQFGQINYKSFFSQGRTITKIISGRHEISVKLDDNTIRIGGISQMPSYVNTVRSRIVDISIGSNFRIVLLNNDSVIGWGKNENMQAFFDRYIDKFQGRIRKVFCFDTNFFIILNDNSVHWIGQDDSAYSEKYQSSPLIVPQEIQNKVQSICSKNLHYIALLNDKTIFGWGDNRDGQISIPPEVQGKVKQIDCGYWFTMVLLEDGTVCGFGDDSKNQLKIPADIQGRVIQIACGASHSLALLNDGSVKGWGNNKYGQITIPSYLVPADVKRLIEIDNKIHEDNLIAIPTNQKMIDVNEIGYDIFKPGNVSIKQFIKDPENLNDSFIWKMYDQPNKGRTFMINKTNLIGILQGIIVYPCIYANGTWSIDNVLKNVAFYNFGKIFDVRILIKTETLDRLLTEPGNIFAISNKKLLDYTTIASKAFFEELAEEERLNPGALETSAAVSAQHCAAGSEKENLWNLKKVASYGYSSRSTPFAHRGGNYKDKYLKYKKKYIDLRNQLSFS